MLIPSLIAGSPSPTCDLGFKSNNCDNTIMGRTIPSYRIASEIEIWKWRPFRKALDKQDRKYLMKCYLFHDSIILREQWLADLS